MPVKIPHFQCIVRGKKKKIYALYFHFLPHPQEMYFSSEKNPWNDVGVGDERDTDEDYSVRLHFLLRNP